VERSLLAVIAMCQAAVPAMRERGWGRLVAITSLGVRQP
jgi:3-oxoacyl-[acyl-carrier protein] reductase